MPWSLARQMARRQKHRMSFHLQEPGKPGFRCYRRNRIGQTRNHRIHRSCHNRSCRMVHRNRIHCRGRRRRIRHSIRRDHSHSHNQSFRRRIPGDKSFAGRPTKGHRVRQKSFRNRILADRLRKSYCFRGLLPIQNQGLQLHFPSWCWGLQIHHLIRNRCRPLQGQMARIRFLRRSWHFLVHERAWSWSCHMGQQGRR